MVIKRLEYGYDDRHLQSLASHLNIWPSFYEGWIEEVSAEAWRILSTPSIWDALLKLAKELKRKRTLTGDRVRQVEYARERQISVDEKPLLETCRHTVQRLSVIQPVPEIEAITPNSAEKVFAVLAKSVRESIQKNEPESGLDRLHTFVVKYIRVLCEKRGISTERDKPLHSLVGEYTRGTLLSVGFANSTERHSMSVLGQVSVLLVIDSEREVAAILL